MIYYIHLRLPRLFKKIYKLKRAKQNSFLKDQRMIIKHQS